MKDMSRKEVGDYGENVAAAFLKRRGFRVIDRNVRRKTGEIDIIVRKGDTLHFVEVKSVLCKEFPVSAASGRIYDPSSNLHERKIRRVSRTGEWYAANQGWEGHLAVDGVLVWLRERDGVARVSYLPQIL